VPGTGLVSPWRNPATSFACLGKRSIQIPSFANLYTMGLRAVDVVVWLVALATEKKGERMRRGEQSADCHCTA
jgi:hypothetical protein